MNRKLLVTLLIISTLVIGCAKKENNETETNWLDVGVGPEKIADIPYRLIEMGGPAPLPATNTDLATLIMSLQSGSARGTWVYIPVYKCWAPKVRDRIPSVACESRSGSDVIIGGEDNIREVLLGLKADGKIAAVKGKVMGLYADHPVVWVSDPALKRKTN